MHQIIKDDICKKKTSTPSLLRLATCMFAVLLMIGFTAGGNSGHATDTPNKGPSTILVELFTSEGCSTCPPADLALEQMDKQPIPGAQLIVLSEHVDYWDHEGWKDPYSSPAATDRQNEYVHAFSLKTAYTPQIFVDGSSEMHLNDPNQVNQVFQKALSATKTAVRIASLTVDTETSTVVRGRIEVDENSEKNKANVYVVIALDHVESQVMRGENGGKHLSHVAVVQELKKIAKLEKGKGLDQEFKLKLKPGTDPANVRIIAFVQDPGPGRVWGAAFRKLEN
jgi:hypothetical protein